MWGLTESTLTDSLSSSNRAAEQGRSLAFSAANEKDKGTYLFVYSFNQVKEHGCFSHLITDILLTPSSPFLQFFLLLRSNYLHFNVRLLSSLATPYSWITFLENLITEFSKSQTTFWLKVLANFILNRWSYQLLGLLFFSVTTKGHQQLLAVYEKACCLAWPSRENMVWLLTLEKIRTTYVALMKMSGK